MSRRFRGREFEDQRGQERENLRKGIYILPNLFTSASLFAGFYSIVATMKGDFQRAAWAVVVAGLCDAADGRVARFTHTTSRFGVEYDSLADLIAFGVAPGLLVYNWALLPYDNWGWSAAFLFVICGALRLARYNVQIDTIESVTFNGLPIPAAAGMVVTTVLLSHHLGYAGPVQHVSIPIMVFLLALLMVSNVKFVSFKEMQLRRRKPFTLFLALIILLVLVANEPAIVLFILSAVYVLHGPVRGLILWRKKSHSPDTAAAQAQDQENPAQGTTQRETNPLPSEEDDDGDSPLP